MTLSHPWGLLALSSIGIVILIHIFQHRYRKRRISGLFIWQEGQHHALSGKRIQKPPATFSLILEILACIMLSLLLSGAGCEMKNSQRHIVFVLDNSGSMAAAPLNGEPFKKRAEKKIKEILAKEKKSTVTLIATGPTPSFIFGPEENPAQIDKSFSRWQCTKYNHDILPALTLAKNIEGASGETIVISDNIPASIIPSITWISIGESLSNAAFTGAYRIRKENGQDLVRLSIKTFGGIKTVRVTVREGKNIILDKTVSPAKEPDITFLVPSKTKTIRAEIPGDALLLDNLVLLPPPSEKIVRCMEVYKGREKRIIDPALLCVPGTVLVQKPPADLYVGPGTEIHKTPGDAWILAFAPYSEELVSGEGVTFLGPYTTDTTNPLLSATSFKGVAWHSPGILKSLSFPVVSCGNRPLVVEADPPRSGFLFNLDLSKTNLFRTKTWPVLFYNLIELVKNTLPGPGRTNFRAGETLTLTLPPFESKKVLVKGDDWEQEINYRKNIFLNLPTRTMKLEIIDGEKTIYSIATNWIDPKESDLTRLAPGYVKGKQTIRSQAKTASGWSNPLFQLLLWLLAATFFANWLITRKRKSA